MCLKLVLVGGVCVLVQCDSESCFGSLGRAGGSVPGKSGGDQYLLTGSWEMLALPASDDQRVCDQ